MFTEFYKVPFRSNKRVVVPFEEVTREQIVFKHSPTTTLEKFGHYLILCLIVFLCINSGKVLAQGGYLNLHLQTLNEVGSPSVDFTISGPGGFTRNITLNDDPTRAPIRDIGASQSGRLYAVTEPSGNLYYRNAGSATWIHSGLSGIYRVDGGNGNSAWIVTDAGHVFRLPGTGSPLDYTVVYAYVSGTNWKAIDVAMPQNATDNKVFVLRANSQIFQYDGSGFADSDWAYIIGGFTGIQNIDANPTGEVYFATANNVYGYSIGATFVSVYGSPYSNIADIAVVGADLFASDGASLGAGVKKFNYSTITWSASEPESYTVGRITGSINNQFWGIYRVSDANAGTGNIFSRAYNGLTGAILWVDDERVRPTTPGNTVLYNLLPGVYTITQTNVPNWEVQKISIFNPSSSANTTNYSTRTATVTIQEGNSTNVIWQVGNVNPFAMTTNCSNKYLETFGTGLLGSIDQAPNGQTTYHYQGDVSQWIPDGYYRLITRGSDFGDFASSITADHTVDAGGAIGRMYAVNAGFDKGEFFRRRFTGLVVGARYKFASWIASASNTTIKPNVSFKVYDATTKAILTSNNTGNINTAFVWNQYNLEFVATSTAIDLVLDNNNVGGVGNDLVLDDISFELLPPPGPLTFNITAATCAGSTGTIEVTAPVGSNIEYALDASTTYQTSPIFSGVSIAPHTVRARYITTIGCELSNVAIMTVSACGNVFNDANGLTNNLVDGTGIGTASGSTLYVNLYNSTGAFISATPVSSAGTYTLQNLVPGTQYTSTVSTTMGTSGSTLPTEPALPTGWVNTGEKNGTGSGGDGIVDGKLTFTVPSASMNNVNFGIEQRPTAGAGTNTLANIPGTAQISVPANTFVNTSNSTDPSPGVVSSIVITSIPTGATTIDIDGTTYGPGFTTFPSTGVSVPTTSTGQPTVTITVNPTLDGATTVTIPFVAVDNAGVRSSNTGNAVINFTVPCLTGTITSTITGITCTGATGTIVVTAPIGTNIEYSLNGTTYQTSSTFSSVVGGSYTLRARTIGTTGCDITSSIVMPVSICGTVYNDADGLLGSPANTINGTGIGTVSDVPLYANLFNSSGVFVASVIIPSTGDYTIPNVPAGANYVLTLSTTAATSITTLSSSTSSSLPTGWTNVGEFIGTGAGNDGTPNGQLNITAGTTSVVNTKFGIQELPTAGAGSATLNNIPGVNNITIPATAFTNTNNSTDPIPGSISSIVITAIPSGATTITINDITYGPGFTIFPVDGVIIPATPTGAPSQTIRIDPAADVNTTISIPFVAVDNAGSSSSNTGLATINFVIPPDLTPVIVLPLNNFSVGTTRDFIVQLNELVNSSTTGPLAFNITVPTGYVLSFDNTQTTSFVASSGTHAVSNNNWNVIESTSTATNFDLQSNATFIIAGGTNTKLGFTIQRTSAVFSNSSAVIIVNIYPDPEKKYDSNNSNNVYSRIVTSY